MDIHLRCMSEGLTRVPPNMNSKDFLATQELDELAAAAAPSSKLHRPTRDRRGRRVPASIRNFRRLAGGWRGIARKD